MSRLFQRDPETSDTDIDGEIFLVKASEQDIHHLDGIASGIWRLLAEPRTEAEMATVLHDAFPDVPTERIRADLERALSDLVASGHVHSRAPGAGDDSGV